MMMSTVIAKLLERMPYLDLKVAIAKNWSPSEDFFISIVHVKMSSQFEEYPEAPNIVILPAKIISHTIKPALPKQAEWTLSVLRALQYQDMAPTL